MPKKTRKLPKPEQRIGTALVFGPPRPSGRDGGVQAYNKLFAAKGRVEDMAQAAKYDQIDMQRRAKRVRGQYVSPSQRRNARNRSK